MRRTERDDEIGFGCAELEGTKIHPEEAVE